MAEITDKPFDEEIELQEHNPAWEDNYRTEASILENSLFQNNLSNVLGGFQHFGSTSIPGIKAKPAIGIMCGLTQWPPSDRVIETLQAKDYTYYGQMGHRPRHYLRKRNGSQQFNIHIVEFNGGVWRDNLLFREYMLCHPEERVEYQRIKEHALLASEGRLNEYGSIKYEFLKNRTQKAILWDKYGRDDAKLAKVWADEEKHKQYRRWKKQSIRRSIQASAQIKLRLSGEEATMVWKKDQKIWQEFCAFVGVSQERMQDIMLRDHVSASISDYWERFKNEFGVRVFLSPETFFSIWHEDVEEVYPGVVASLDTKVSHGIFSRSERAKTAFKSF